MTNCRKIFAVLFCVLTSVSVSAEESLKKPIDGISTTEENDATFRPPFEGATKRTLSTDFIQELRKSREKLHCTNSSDSYITYSKALTETKMNNFAWESTQPGERATGVVLKESESELYLDTRPCDVKPQVIIFHSPYDKGDAGATCEAKCKKVEVIQR